MKRLLVITLALALLPAFLPAKAGSATLADRVKKIEDKLSCLSRAPVNQFDGYASWGDPVTSPNLPTNVDDPNDHLRDLGYTVGLDWDFGATPEHGFWVLTVKNTSTCRNRWSVTPTPSWWGGGARLAAMRLAQLTRAR